ncbi:MAG: glycosyltransferase family 4 protein [Candidatus Methylomirabilales bacterium]
MKILHLHSQPVTAYGTERYIMNVCRALRDGGHQVTLGLDSGRSHNEELESLQPDVAVCYVGELREEDGGESIRTLEALIGAQSPDVVILHHVQNAEIVQALPRLIPTIHYFHDSRFVCLGAKYHFWWGRACTRQLSPACLFYAYASHCATVRLNHLIKKLRTRRKVLEASKRLPQIIVESEYMRSLLKLNGVGIGRVAVIPPFPETFRSVTESPPLDAPAVVLFVGRLSVEKGAHHLLEALGPLRDPYRAVIVGDGPERRQLERLAAGLGITGRVDFIGWLRPEDLARYYGSARCVVVPSLWPEPFGLVGLEAMAYGQPVVGYDSGAIREWLQDGVTGFLVPRGDMVSLRAAVHRIIRDSEIRHAMGTKAKAFVGKVFSKTRHMSRLIGAMKLAITGGA